MNGSYRPAGARCLHCAYARARLHKQSPALATNWCSDRCRIAWHRNRDRARMTERAEEIRRLIGLPSGRGPMFTLPELEALERRLKRALPYAPLPHYPATNDKHRQPRRRTDA